jgi:hypothetical protein
MANIWNIWNIWNIYKYFQMCFENLSMKFFIPGFGTPPPDSAEPALSSTNWRWLQGYIGTKGLGGR